MDREKEFSADRTPENQLVAWPRVAAVAAMVSFSLPTFITGLKVSGGLAATDAMLALFVGSLIIFLVGAVVGAIGAHTRMNSYLLVRIAFGDAGARVVNLAFAISLLGWFGVNINLFAEAAGRLSTSLFSVHVDALWLSIFASVCMTGTTLIGFRAINVLSVLLVPVLALVTLLLVYSALEAQSLADIIAIDRAATLSLGDGISAIVGSIIIGAIILPDITRFLRHWRGAVYSAGIAYLVVQLVVMASAAVAGRVMGETDILQILLNVDLGLGAFAIVIAGSWVLNSLNLYSAVLSTKATFEALPAKWLTIGLGIMGVIAALLNILDSFVTFLFYLSIVFIPVAGVITIDFLFIRRSTYSAGLLGGDRGTNVNGLIAWSMGAIVAVLGSELLLPSITRIAALDAMILSGVVYFALSWRSRDSRAR